mgnify:CR=1 FL=1|tara:strand:- start:6186 stop:6461 length:276 start_codon:yes stop_codon:yes gene_type:complete
MADKDPFNYKRTKERNLPFTRASRCLLVNSNIKEVLATPGLKFVGENFLEDALAEEGEEGYLDVENVIMVLVREIAKLHNKVNELEELLDA